MWTTAHLSFRDSSSVDNYYATPPCPCTSDGGCAGDGAPSPGPGGEAAAAGAPTSVEGVAGAVGPSGACGAASAGAATATTSGLALGVPIPLVICMLLSSSAF